MKSIDHAAIFALIAGSATPICLLGLKGQLGSKILIPMWIIAILGMIVSIFWARAPKWVRALLYVALGWLAIPFFHEIKSALDPLNLWLLLSGGIIYTVGALIYAFKWPNPSPKIFGYHEIFHLFVVIATALHFTIIYRLT